MPYQGQRYNTRNQNPTYGTPLDANSLQPTNLYSAGPTSYMMNRSNATNTAAPDSGLQSIMNHKFFQPNNIAPPTAPGSNTCAFQYQPLSYSPYHAYGQMPYNQPQAVPE